ncbi:MAG: M81 family metallopeptidase [Polynucleobacter sp.]|nr:M81 family metallopeptidase [Polynucleobacter sp.]
MKPKFVIARFQHETNTFSPIPTPLTAFHPLWGEAAYRDQENARTAMGAFIHLAKEVGAEIITPVCAFSNPSATVQADAYQTVCKHILDAIKLGCDAILLDLHGAMVADGAVDGEGSLLERIRQIAPNTPIAVALDLHANVTPKMVKNCNVMVSFKTYPHIDMYETGLHAGQLLLDLIAQKIQPAIVYRQLPLLSHTLRSNTQQGAMKLAVEAAQAMEKRTGVLAISILAGFSLADFHDTGMSVIVITDQLQDPKAVLANQLADELQTLILHHADGFVYASIPTRKSLENATALAKNAGHGPILLLDHSDNVMSGGSCDTTDILEAALSFGLSNLAVGPITDPQTVQQLISIGLNQVTTIELGNKSGWTYRGQVKPPFKLQGKMIAISDGRVLVTGPIFTGSTLQMGASVLFETEHAHIVISSERVEPYDLGVMTSLGIQLENKSFVLLKSRMYCRPVFLPLSKGFVECDSDQGGPSSSNYRWFEFKQIRRPIYPLDLTALPN